jgi:hypothetical protein
MLSFSVTTIQNFNPNKHDIMQIITHFVMFDVVDVLLYLNCTQVWHVPLARVLPRLQLIFPFETWFLGIYLNFQQQKSLKNQHFPHFESKYYQINSIKSCSSRSFQQHQSTFQSLQKFQLGFDLIFSEKIIQYSRPSTPQVQTPLNQAHVPLLLESFLKRPRTQFEASQFSGSHKYKQNKQITLLHR